MRPFAILFIILSAIFVRSQSTAAAELVCLIEGFPEDDTLYHKPAPNQPLTGKCIKAALRGRIVTGDFEKVRSLIHESWPRLLILELESNGGSVYEALKVGRLIRKFLVTTYVPRGRCHVEELEGLPPLPSGAWIVPPFSHSMAKDPATAPPFDPSRAIVIPNDPETCLCASACALIWFGGIERMGTVGLHRPKINDPEFANSPPEKAMARYRSALAEIDAYLSEMESPRSIIDTMVTTSSAQINWVSARKNGLSRPPSYAEWEDLSCDHYDSEQEPLFDYCRNSLRRDRVSKLSPP